MTDSDRLRKAADFIDYAYGRSANAGKHTQAQLDTAALLRAVADERRPMPTRVVAAALDLADTILGGNT